MVVLIIKKGDSKLPDNYRQKSLVCLFGKKIHLKQRFGESLQKFNVLHRNQFGFQKGHCR